MNNLITFTLFGSGVAFGIMLILLLIVLIASDINETGPLATISIIVALILNYIWGTFPVLSIITLKNVLGYLVIGFIFSLIRTYFKGKELTLDEKRYFELKDHVFRWWFLFPISALNWVFGHLLKDVFDFIYSKISSLYNHLFNG